MPVKFGFVIFARCIARHVLMQMLIGGAAARRQLVARGLGNHVAAAAGDIPALFARRLHLIPACAVETLQPPIGDDAIFSRVGINTGYSAAAGRRGNPSVKVLCADDQFVGVFAEAVRAWLLQASIAFSSESEPE
jgi:hypothetical protein